MLGGELLGCMLGDGAGLNAEQQPVLSDRRGEKVCLLKSYFLSDRGVVVAVVVVVVVVVDVAGQDVRTGLVSSVDAPARPHELRKKSSPRQRGGSLGWIGAPQQPKPARALIGLQPKHPAHVPQHTPCLRQSETEIRSTERDPQSVQAGSEPTERVFCVP